MLSRLERDATGLLVLAVMVEGCGYYGCKDNLKRDYVPQEFGGVWRDARTLELDFHTPLRAPTDVDPRRFALLRYGVEFQGADYYTCSFEVCYRGLGAGEMIPESLDWDPAKPQILRLNFADPIPASACEPWKGEQANYQALGLIYLGTEPDLGGTDTGEDLPALDQLVYTDDEGVRALGPARARDWLEGCFAGGSCDVDEFCVTHGGYEQRPWWEDDLWVGCPE